MSIVPVDTTDDQLVALWLQGRPASTIRVYGREIERFRAWTGMPLRQLSIIDLHQYLLQRGATLAPATMARIIATLQSLFGYGHAIGLLQFDIARTLRSPVPRDRLVERILTPDQVYRMLAATRNDRDRTIIRLLYVSGCRVSELCGLSWRDCVTRGEGGQVTVLGKGSKTRAIVLPPATWLELLRLGRGTGDDPVIVGRHGTRLTAGRIRQIVYRAAIEAKLTEHVSPHWMRHSHATHALEAGASISLVQNTLGHSSVAMTGRYLHVRPGESSGRYLPLG